MDAARIARLEAQSRRGKPAHRPAQQVAAEIAARAAQACLHRGGRASGPRRARCTRAGPTMTVREIQDRLPRVLRALASDANALMYRLISSSFEKLDGSYGVRSAPLGYSALRAEWCQASSGGGVTYGSPIALGSNRGSVGTRYVTNRPCICSVSCLRVSRRTAVMSSSSSTLV